MKILPFIKIIKETFSKKKKNDTVKKINDPYETSLDTIHLHSNAPKEQYQKRHTEDHEDEAADHYYDLKNTADLVNEDLKKNDNQFRFNIYKENNEIFIDIVRLDENNNVIEVKQKNITHEEFRELIKQIELTEGFFFDGVG